MDNLTEMDEMVKLGVKQNMEDIDKIFQVLRLFQERNILQQRLEVDPDLYIDYDYSGKSELNNLNDQIEFLLGGEE